MTKWIDQDNVLSSEITHWSLGRPIGLDTEFMRTNTFSPRLALVQINIEGRIALIDAPALNLMPALAAFLSNPQTLTIIHSASEDIEALAPIVPTGPNALFDTQIAAAMVGMGFGLSYQKLVFQLLETEIPKAETRSDWLQRPLTAEQLEYAAQDVAHLPAIHEELTNRLEKLHRSTWLAEDCERMIDRARSPEPDAEPQRAFRNASTWPLERQALLRKILHWRESAARRYDQPRYWLLSDAVLFDLVELPPGNIQELEQRTRGLRSLRSAQRAELMQQFSDPLTDADLNLRPIPPPLNRQQKNAIAAMKEAVASVALELQLPEGLLCSRRHLETLINDGIWPTALAGWREQFLRARLIALLP